METSVRKSVLLLRSDPRVFGEFDNITKYGDALKRISNRNYAMCGPINPQLSRFLCSYGNHLKHAELPLCGMTETDLKMLVASCPDARATLRLS